ncbi:MAG TPA: multicopper oxidase domain-containing protein [Steroidobacteraceae bacterium]|nr:multicopper oxidase domain-containing protein [Steroidobacteraceae bacterium]
MTRAAIIFAAWICAAPIAAAPVAAAPGYDPRSTPAAPCGIGVPAPGHTSPEIDAAAGPIALTVRQDGSRLCYTANGSADAPVIHVRQGAELTITLHNEITDPAAIDAVSGPAKLITPNEPVPRSAGLYRVVAGMRHHATGRTNLHVHGFAVPPVRPQDDVLTVCTDPASGSAGCGRRSFTYHFRLPADMPEGLYWYHPHVHGEVQAQMLMGLSGAIIVEGAAQDARRAAGIREQLLIVRQTQDLDAGRTQSAAMTAAPPGEAGAPLRGPLPPATAIDTAHELLCTSSSGIDQISLNGTPVALGDAPDAALAHYSIAAGSRQYWRVLNGATDAFLDLALVDEHGNSLPLEVVAQDGAPRTDDAGTPLAGLVTREAQLVPPAGRIEMLIAAPPPGTRAYLITRAVDTGCAGDRVPERRLAVIEASGESAVPAGAAGTSALPVSRPTFFSGMLAQHTDRERVIAMAEYPRPGQEDQVDFYIVERKPGAVLKPFEMGDPPAISVRAGSTEEWVVENWTHELHAFHIHQVHFRVLDIDGVPLAQPPLLDTITVPYATATGYHSKEGPVRPGRVRIKLTFPAALAGDIPFHCHLTDHEDNGMMAVLRVLP